MASEILPPEAFPNLEDINWDDPLEDHPLNTSLGEKWITLPGHSAGTTWYGLKNKTAGTLTNFTAGNGWNSSSPPGGAGSLKFTNSTNQVDLGLWSQFNGIATATWAFSFCLLSSATGRILTKWGGSAVRSFDFEIIAGPKLQVAMNYGGSIIVYNPATVLSVGTWYRCVVAMKGGSPPQIYLNGSLVLGTGTNAAALLSSTSHVQLGFESVSSVASANMLANDVSLLPGTYWPPSLVSLDYQLGQQGYPGVLRRRQRGAYSVPSTTNIWEEESGISVVTSTWW